MFAQEVSQLSRGSHEQPIKKPEAFQIQTSLLYQTTETEGVFFL